VIHGPAGDLDPGLAYQLALGDGRALDERIVGDSSAAHRTLVSRAWTEVPGRVMSFAILRRQDCLRRYA